jgi:hypothetical protein
MVKVTDVLDRIAREVSIEPPDGWISATETEYVEIRDDFFAETISDILDRVDLPSPIGAQYTLPTDDSESYDLPADFLRLARDPLAVYETTTQRRPLTPVSSDGMWSHIKEIGSTGAYRYYQIGGYPGASTISIFGAPSSGIEIIISYVSANWCKNANTDLASILTDAEATLLIPRRVVEAGTVMRWRERKGLQYERKAAEYEVLIARLSNDTRVRREILFSDCPVRNPWDIPVPDYIPPA